MNLNDKQKSKIAQSVAVIAFALAALAAAVHFTDSREAETQSELVEVETETGKKKLTEAMLAVTNEMAEKYAGIDMEAETEAEVETQEEESAETVDTQDIVDEYYYAAATPMTKGIVEEYASNVRSLFLQRNWSSLAGLIEFPITIDGITYDTRESFMQGGLDDIYSEDFMSDIEAEDCVDIYCSSTGIWLGGYDNNVMIADVGDDEISVLKIVSVKGLIDEDKVVAKEKSWARAYYDFVVDTYDNSYFYSDWYVDYIAVNKFALIYLDYDDIPEMVVQNDYGHAGSQGAIHIYAYYQGNIKEIIEYVEGGGLSHNCLSYYPFSGLICEEGHTQYAFVYKWEYYMLNEKCELECLGTETEYNQAVDDERYGQSIDYWKTEIEGTLPSDDVEWEYVHRLDYMSYTEILSQLCEAGNF